MDFLDTSVVVRYLTDDPPDMAEQAERIIETSANLVLSETTLLESAHVLRSVYELERENILDLLIALLDKPNISLLNIPKEIAVEALGMCRSSNRISFSDAIIWASARSSSTKEIAIVYSFDKRFPRKDIEVRSKI